MKDGDHRISNVSDLQIFARVARVGNMSAAGRLMGLMPAVVSKRISLLEEQIGARLFQRTTRQLTLTDVGEGLFKRAVDILALIDEAEDFVCRHGSGPRGTVRIIAPTSFGRRCLAPALTAFQADHPQIEFEVDLSDSRVDIIRHGYDVAIGFGGRSDDGMLTRQLASCPRILCASPGYLDEAGRPARPGELAVHQCLAEGERELWQLVSAAESEDLQVRSAIRSNSADFIREFDPRRRRDRAVAAVGCRSRSGGRQTGGRAAGVSRQP